jgi:hypothetical protein
MELGSVGNDVAQIGIIVGIGDEYRSVVVTSFVCQAVEIVVLAVVRHSRAFQKCVSCHTNGCPVAGVAAGDG